MNNRVPDSCVVGHEKRPVPRAPVNGVIPESQPTRCGHTLARCPLPGLARGVAPSNPFLRFLRLFRILVCFVSAKAILWRAA